MEKWLTTTEFTAACNALPLISIDLVIVNDRHELLLGLRSNRPAQDWWFTPGGRIRKNEPWDAAMQRVTETELGLDFAIFARPQLMGVWDHFYDTSAFDIDTSTHYVNLPHVLVLNGNIDLDTLPQDQHSAWMWMDSAAASQNVMVHAYARNYAKWIVDNLQSSL